MTWQSKKWRLGLQDDEVSEPLSENDLPTTIFTDIFWTNDMLPNCGGVHGDMLGSLPARLQRVFFGWSERLKYGQHMCRQGAWELRQNFVCAEETADCSSHLGITGTNEDSAL